MSRQLPVPARRNQNDLTLADPRSLDSQQSTASRLAVALAPEILRAVERIAVNRTPRRTEFIQPTNRFPSEAIRFSEVEIDVSVPFIQKITMRNATAWTAGAMHEVTESKHSGLKWAGMIGIGGAAALAAGILARKRLPRAVRDGRIVDITGSSTPET